MANAKIYPKISAAHDPNWLKKVDAQPLWDSWSTQLFPKNLEEAIWWGNWLRTRFGDVATAIYRKETYFLDGIELDNDMKDLESRDMYTKELLNRHRILQTIATVGMDIQFYGNAFISAHQPITRTIICPKCRQQRYINSLERGVDYDFTNGAFISKCAGCKYSGKFIDKVYPNRKAKRPLDVIHWNPMSMDIDFCSMTGAEKITFNPQQVDRSFVDNEATSAALESLPPLLLRALVEDRPIQFRPDKCLHLAAESDSLNSSELKGWGLPKFLPAFRYVVMLMLLDRQTEAAVKDFILPIRLLFPDTSYSKGGSDPMGGVNVLHMGNLRRSVESALAAQAHQQSSWQLIPAPVQQLQLGGDGKALVPVELLNFAKTTMLDILNVPAEFFQSSLNSAQAAANSMKLFEQTNIYEVNLKNDCLNWYLGRCKDELGYPEMSGEILTPADSQNQERLSMLMDLKNQGFVSATTIARMFGINPARERYRIREEQLRQARDNRELQQLISQSDSQYAVLTTGGQIGLENAVGMMQQAAQGADPAMQGGGAPMPAGGGGGGGAPVQGPMPGADPMMQIQNLKSIAAPQAATPDQLSADAEVAADILFNTPIGSPREQIYAILRNGNQTLYEITKSKLQQKENMARSQGLQQARQGG